MAQETRWFVELVGDITYVRFAELLAQEQIVIEAESSIVVDGRQILVFRVPYRFITLLQRFEQHRDKFRVYSQEGEGRIRKSKLHTLNQNRHKRSRAYKDMEALTKRLKKK